MKATQEPTVLPATNGHAPTAAGGFLVRHLAAEQVARLYEQALQQAEAAALQAHVNVVVNPTDMVAAATLAEALARVAALEADEEATCRRSG